MSEADAASLLREVLDALTAHNLDRVAAVVDERFEFVDVGGGEEAHGREQWRAFCGRFVKAFPDSQQMPSALTQRAIANQANKSYDAALDDLNMLLTKYPAATEREAALQQTTTRPRCCRS